MPFLIEQRVREPLALLLLGLGGAAVRLGQHQLHHALGEPRVAPEDVEGLVEDRALLFARQQHRRHGPVPVVAAVKGRFARRDLERPHAVDGAVGADAQAGGAQQAREMHHVFRKPAGRGAVHAGQAAAAALASPTRRTASSPATRSRSSRYLSSTPSVLLTVPGSSATRSSAVRQFAQSMVSATPGSLYRSVLRRRCTKATTSRDSAAPALGALRRRISSSCAASG